MSKCKKPVLPWLQNLREASALPSWEGSDVAYNERGYYSGIDNAEIFERFSVLNIADPEWHTGTPGAGIRIGRDRMNEKKVKHLTWTGNSGASLGTAALRMNSGEPNEPVTNYKFGDGYGSDGATGCSAVDIYCGLNSHALYCGDIPDVPVNPNAFRDAARVYISAMCDVDRLFGLAKGNIPDSAGKSAAVIKADQTRIIGREGVKIMTGTDGKNSKMRPIPSKPSINLIAGGATSEDMHPIPKGKNVVKALETIVERINDLSGILDGFLQFQNKFNAVLMSHTHPSPTSIAIGVLAVGKPDAFCNGQTLASWDCAVGGYEACISALKQKKDLLVYQGAMAGTKLQNLEKFSPKFINSRQVFTS